ncbi:hypothetical protein D4764_13G0009410 [Takifugu flavidus]|uniref:Alkylated DNA repair protein AlkB homologue 8 N-terminal domain-containing protein n=1 Tax=Takifugu flavidus TaxID=433684 RepID=A0A5C6PBA1_9TELE|nr:hypothetical protein D4764_13G0009410 [Takifugu flavidus]
MSPFLYSLFTHDCRALHGSNTIIKITIESAYREEVDRLATWCHNNNLLLNTNTKELVLDFRRKTDIHPPIHINGAAVEHVSSFKFLGIHLSQDLTWTTNCSSLVKKAHQRLFFLRTLKKNHLSSDILVNFYRCTIERILTSCVTVWYGNCSASDRKALQKVVKTAQRIAGAPLPAIEDIYRRRAVTGGPRRSLKTPVTQRMDCSPSCPLGGATGASGQNPPGSEQLLPHCCLPAEL